MVGRCSSFLPFLSSFLPYLCIVNQTKIVATFDDEENATSKRGPMNMLTLLKDEFTMEDLILVRRKLGKSVDTTSVKNQLNTWRVRKLVDYEDIETGIKKIKR